MGRAWVCDDRSQGHHDEDAVDTRGGMARDILQLTASWISRNLFGGKLRTAHLVQTLLSHIDRVPEP
jgi:hypothetical protein